MEEEEPLELDDSKLESFIITGGVNTSNVLTPDSKNRYKDRDARDALINKLLAERKHTKTADTNSEGSEKNSPGTLAARVADIANESVRHQATPLIETPSGQGASSIRVKRSGSVVIEFDGTSDKQDPDALTTRKSTAKKTLDQLSLCTRPGSSARTKQDRDERELNESFLDTSFKQTGDGEDGHGQMMPYSYGTITSTLHAPNRPSRRRNRGARRSHRKQSWGKLCGRARTYKDIQQRSIPAFCTQNKGRRRARGGRKEEEGMHFSTQN